MVKRFFFGINHFDISSVSTENIQQIFESVSGNFKDINDAILCKSDAVSLCHCAFEYRSNQVINDHLSRYLVSLPSGFDGIKMDFNLQTARDCTAVLFVISNIQENHGVAINFDNCRVKEKHIIKLVELSEGKLEIVHLNLSGNRLTMSGLQAFENAVRGNLFAKLEKLDLSGSLTSDADAAWLTTFTEALSAHCPHLGSLDLSDNNLGVPSWSVCFIKNFCH
jgi:hypothetical protein